MYIYINIHCIYCIYFPDIHDMPSKIGLAPPYTVGCRTQKSGEFQALRSSPKLPPWKCEPRRRHGQTWKAPRSRRDGWVIIDVPNSHWLIHRGACGYPTTGVHDDLLGGEWLPFLAFSQKYWVSVIIPIDEVLFFRGVGILAQQPVMVYQYGPGPDFSQGHPIGWGQWWDQRLLPGMVYNYKVLPHR